MSYDGVSCNNATNDTSGLCAVHRKYFRQLIEVEIMHCQDCPLPVYQESGEVNERATKARCSMYMSNPGGACFFELTEIFRLLNSKDAVEMEFEWVLGKEKILLKRAMLFATKAASVTPEIMKMSDQYLSHLERFTKLKGFHIPTNKGPHIPIGNEKEALELLKDLMDSSDGTADVDNLPYRKAAESLTPRDSRVVEEKYDGTGGRSNPMAKDVAKSDIVKDILDSEADKD